MTRVLLRRRLDWGSFKKGILPTEVASVVVGTVLNLQIYFG